MTEYPYRLVDRHNQGWLTQGNGSYRADYGENRDLSRMTLADLEQTRGPLRPVEPVTDADEDILREAFRRCARKTVTTIAAALDVVFHELREAQGGLTNAGLSYDYAKRTLRAGREGSWESEVLIDIVLFGNGLNITKRGPVHTVEARRALGPSKRVDRESRDTIAGVIRRWVTDPARYTEVAATLAYLVSTYSDETAYGGEEDVRLVDDPHGLLGWKTVADQWIQPDRLPSQDFVSCYRLLYSQSAHFNAGLI